jgi:hypothetical protein
LPPRSATTVSIVPAVDLTSSIRPGSSDVISPFAESKVWRALVSAPVASSMEPWAASIAVRAAFRDSSAVFSVVTDASATGSSLTVKSEIAVAALERSPESDEKSFSVLSSSPEALSRFARIWLKAARFSGLTAVLSFSRSEIAFSSNSGAPVNRL